MISFTIPGSVVPFARAGARGSARFTPRRQADYMALVRLAAANAMNGQAPFDGPVEMTVRAVYPIPASWPKAKRNAARWRVARPDCDNIAKLVADAISQVVYGDDAQIASLAVQKLYGEIPGTIVSVTRLVTEAAA